MSDRAIVAVFPTANSAYEAASAIRNLADDKLIDFKVDSGAIFKKDEKGNVIPLEEKGRHLWGTMGGAVAGGLIGALGGPAGAAAGAALGASAGLAGDAVAGSLDRDFVNKLAAELKPGDTAVVVEANEGSTAPVDSIVRSNGGRVYRSDLH
jgi:uncharacterized membrane protein